MTLIIQKPTGAKLIIQKPTGAKLNLAQTYVGLDDPDAAAYITAVEAADGESLETAVKVAIHSFVKGCKNDALWSAIKASCILAGARTLSGALVPLVGTAPTNVGFVQANYDRKTGLVGNGSTRSLNSNRNSRADSQNNKHVAVYATSLTTTADRAALGAGRALTGATVIAPSTTAVSFRNNASTLSTISGTFTSGLFGSSRSLADSYVIRSNGADSSLSVSSELPANFSYGVFSNRTGAGPVDHSDASLAFYSIGESIDLALLDARVTDLINAIAAAIP